MEIVTSPDRMLFYIQLCMNSYALLLFIYQAFFERITLTILKCVEMNIVVVDK